MYYRVEVYTRPEFEDLAAPGFLRRLELAKPSLRKQVTRCRVGDVYWVESPKPLSQAMFREVLEDPVLQNLVTADNHSSTFQILQTEKNAGPAFLERRFKPGVTDNIAKTLQEAIQIVSGVETQCASGSLLMLEGRLSESDLHEIAADVFTNPLIEDCLKIGADCLTGDRFLEAAVKQAFPKVELASKKPEILNLQGRTAEDLETLSRDRLWALSKEEMLAIQSHFSKRSDPPPGVRDGQISLPPGVRDGQITDVEIEVIAQTWSEHCKHKIFGATIDYQNEAQPSESKKIESLFKTTIAGTTKSLPREWLLSVFDDNAGVIAFDDDYAVCVKVETHNSPSALDPYGGALTGIVGVNRDILGCGLGAKPIANTNVFCLAAPDYAKPLPSRLLPPRRILEGVTRGVEHGGNKSGVPTVNGAFAFDDRFLGKPLVYCGTIGWMPRKINGRDACAKEIEPGDRIVMVGGRIGKDGIHGATFSSLALDEKSPVTAVQLGDPITQKRAADFLLEARDLGLYRAITDNGAGGLSSSVGELARITGGADMDVAKAKTKYPGLSAFELTVSESQERMTIVVPPVQMAAFTELAKSRGVEISDLGEFNTSGRWIIRHQDEVVANLDLKFLHEGCPKLKLIARWKESDQKNTISVADADTSFEVGSTLQKLLATPDIASKEWLIRQYDHEVQGQSVLKPLTRSGEYVGPNDGGVILPRADSKAGLVIGCGLAPWYSDIDGGLMAELAVDEAIRNIIAAGAEFGQPENVISLCDNFCWPDPVKNERFCADLVRACFSMQKVALEYEVPLISGKDSMKNDYLGKLGNQEVTISVLPTLLMTAVAKVPNIQTVRSSEFKNAGDIVIRLGLEHPGLRKSAIDRLENRRFQSLPKPDFKMAKRLYSWISGSARGGFESIHDVSEGGLLTALAECTFARNLGAQVTQKLSFVEAFGEGFHGFVVSAKPEVFKSLEKELQSLRLPFAVLGTVFEKPEIHVNGEKIQVADLRRAWNKEGYWQ